VKASVTGLLLTPEPIPQENAAHDAGQGACEKLHCGQSRRHPRDERCGNGDAGRNASRREVMCHGNNEKLKLSSETHPAPGVKPEAPNKSTLPLVSTSRRANWNPGPALAAATVTTWWAGL